MFCEALHTPHSSSLSTSGKRSRTSSRTMLSLDSLWRRTFGDGDGDGRLLSFQGALPPSSCVESYLLAAVVLCCFLCTIEAPHRGTTSYLSQALLCSSSSVSLQLSVELAPLVLFPLLQSLDPTAAVDSMSFGRRPLTTLLTGRQPGTSLFATIYSSFFAGQSTIHWNQTTSAKQLASCKAVYLDRGAFVAL